MINDIGKIINNISLYYSVLKENNNLLIELNNFNKNYINELCYKIIDSLEIKFENTFKTIKYYKGHNNFSKFLLSQINTYYKNFYLFGDVDYYKYNKTSNIYSNINFIRYKYFEYLIGINQDNKKLVINYIFFFQFLDFIVTKGKVKIQPSKIIDVGYNLFGKFLELINKLEYLTKYRLIYSYYSILNIELINNIGISRYFTDYPYSVRFLVYKINKYIKNNSITDKNQIKDIIEKEIENKKNKIGSKFKKPKDGKEGGKEYINLVNNILNIIIDEELSEDDKTIIGILKESGGIDNGNTNNIGYYNFEYNNDNQNIDEKIKNLLLNHYKFLFNKKIEYINYQNIKIFLVLFRLFDIINIDKILILNNKFGNINNNDLIGILGQIKSKTKGFININKNKFINKDLIDNNKKIFKF